ncbi:MAG: hypothetical protein ACI841_001324 [Planctomycetota bacterium]|jgi:hypothetical protein
MQYQPRTIAFVTELFHEPMQPDPRPIQKLHNEMFESGVPAYSSFSATPAGPVLSNPTGRPGAVSQVAFLPDRIQFREELGGVTNEEFAIRVRQVAEVAAPMRGIQQFAAQQAVVRSLVNPKAFKDARDYLRDGMFDFENTLQTFDRPPQLFGLRLAFPPGDDHQNAFGLRVESYAQDPRSLFLEVQGSFGPLATLGGMNELEERVGETYQFLHERVLPFLAQFDLAGEQ